MCETEIVIMFLSHGAVVIEAMSWGCWDTTGCDDAGDGDRAIFVSGSHTRFGRRLAHGHMVSRQWEETSNLPEACVSAHSPPPAISSMPTVLLRGGGQFLVVFFLWSLHPTTEQTRLPLSPSGPVFMSGCHVCQGHLSLVSRGSQEPGPACLWVGAGSCPRTVNHIGISADL